jgi:hypothetical protein
LPKPKASATALAILVLSLVVMMLSPTIRAADPTTQITLTPPMYIATSVGEVFTEIVNFSTTEQIHSVDFTITYNTSYLDIATLTQGSFFPQYFPPTTFTYEKNATAGTLRISISLIDPQTQTGNGTLANVIFTVAEDPKSIAFCPIHLEQITILNYAHQPVNYNTGGAMYFWKYVQPPPQPSNPRVADLFTQIGGIGPNVPGGVFAAGQTVILSANATYNNFPVQHVPVAFQVQNSHNETIAILVGMTDDNGIATAQFRIRPDPSVEGVWMSIATVDISCTIVWDIMNFTVYYPHVVGGYAVTTGRTEKPLTPYFATVAILAAISTITKRKLRKKNRPESNS